MSGSQTDPAVQPAAGLLVRPRALLARLRPVCIEALSDRLREYERTVTGLELLHRHFPDAFYEYDDLSEVGWWEILAALANLVEEMGWFPVAWEALNEGWAIWMEDPADGGDELAHYLRCIPVELYGLRTEEFLEMPPLDLLNILLNEEALAANSQTLIAAELFDTLDEWSGGDRAAAWALLHGIEADPGYWPEPVRWLPELARWVCGRSRNLILDQQADPYSGGIGPCYLWETDLDQVRAAWRRARPVIDQLHRLMAWYEQDESNLVYLANFIMEGKDGNKLTW